MGNGFIDFNYTARYFTLGSPGPEVKHVWFVCHGYGQLSKYFLKKFEQLNDGRHLIIAPEGLSRFYLKGFSGRVGATWMTREEREVDIHNYLQYLNALGNHILQQLPPSVNKTLLGFSQGAATASRWAANTPILFEKFILWAGVFPPDLNIEAAGSKLKNSKTYLIFGDNDPFLTSEKLLEQKIICNQLGIQPEVLQFPGEHDIHLDTLKKLIE